MSDKRYLGNIITPTPTAPAGPFQDSAAPGVWSLQEAFTYTKAGLWPTAGNVAPIGLFGGARITNTSGSATNVIERIVISVLGNATDYGDLTTTSANTASCSSATRGIFASVNLGATTSYNVINYVDISTSGNAVDFGDLTVNTSKMAGSGSSTRGIFFGGANNIITIQYVTIATTGNATSFGILSSGGREQASSCSSPTRSLVANGLFSNSPTLRNNIDYVTIATTGNTTDFGDTTVTSYAGSSVSSGTRGVIGCGYDNTAYALNVLNYVTIATTGNATDFGDLSTKRYISASASSSIRGVFAGGADSSNNAVNVMDYITINTTGNATDFGDLLAASLAAGGCSNAHGGLA